jgi:hypothetical protein
MLNSHPKRLSNNQSVISSRQLDHACRWQSFSITIKNTALNLKLGTANTTEKQ